jgi:glycosyltransferase involved in cell wall biosynthesis
MSDEHPPILLASVLRAERWTSIDLHRQNTLDAFKHHAPDWTVVDIAPDERRFDTRLGKRVLRDFIYPWHVRRQARQQTKQSGRRPIVHVIDHSYGHLCAAWKPSVITCHDLNHFVRPGLRGMPLHAWRVRVRLMKQAEHIFTVSGHLAAEVCNHLGLPEDRVTVAHNGVDQDVFRPMGQAEAAEMFPEVAKLARDHFLVINIGSNLDRKNLATSLRAVAHLRHHEHVPVKFLKIGASLAADGYTPLMQQLGIGDDVVELGMLTPPQVAAICNLAHALSFPSLYEGFGRPTLEAQACGLPCVLADASCMREVGGSGALYHAGTDHEELAARLLEVLRSDEVKQRLVTDGLLNVKRFTWEAHVRKLTAVYQRIASNRRCQEGARRASMIP